MRFPTQMLLWGAFLPLLLLNGCSPQTEREGERTPSDVQKKIGVLLVSHGSRSERWREMLLDVEHTVNDEVLATEGVCCLRTAFMEYNEPSIATQLEKFDAEECSDVILVRLLLTVSAHSFDDIPTIIHAKEDVLTVETLRSEGIERYRPRAQITMTPLLNFTAMLQENVVRRVRVLSRDPQREGVVLVAYGSRDYNDEWEELLAKLGWYLRQQCGISKSTHAWCGHIAGYKRAPTIEAIDEILTTKNRVIVLPMLVAVDEFFQDGIIGGAIADSGHQERVVYAADSILPDDNLNRWIVDIVRENAAALLSSQKEPS